LKKKLLLPREGGIICWDFFEGFTILFDLLNFKNSWGVFGFGIFLGTERNKNRTSLSYSSEHTMHQKKQKKKMKENKIYLSG
jgi:hypothetical protein